MSGKFDQVKGRAKEAAGILTGKEDLVAEGRADRRTGEAEEKIEHAKDRVSELIDKAADKAKDALHRK